MPLKFCWQFHSERFGNVKRNVLKRRSNLNNAGIQHCFGRSAVGTTAYMLVAAITVPVTSFLHRSDPVKGRCLLRRCRGCERRHSLPAVMQPFCWASGIFNRLESIGHRYLLKRKIEYSYEE